MQKLSMRPQTAAVTLQELFDRFIAYKKIQNLSPESIVYYGECFRFFTAYCPANTPCAEIDKDVGLGYVQHLREQNPAIKDTSINTYLRAVRAILYYGMEQGYLPRFKLELIRANKELKETYTDEELALLLKKPDVRRCDFTEYRNWVVINYFLATGNRLGTVVNLKIGDIDFEGGMIALTKTKNRKQQLVPLSATMLRILQEYLKHRQGGADDFLFCNQFGRQFTTDGLKSSLSKYNLILPSH